jgi:hypothetical protein
MNGLLFQCIIFTEINTKNNGLFSSITMVTVIILPHEFKIG